jgi:hypothetical protein
VDKQVNRHASKQAKPKSYQLQLIYYIVFSKHTIRILTPNSSSEKMEGIGGTYLSTKLNTICNGIFLKIKDCEEGHLIFRVNIYSGKYCI